MISSDVFSTRYLADTSSKLALTTNQHLDTDMTHYSVRPTYVDGNLAVLIELPLLNDDKMATLFQITKYPQFINGTKYISTCPTEFVAIYDDSSDYNLLTREELTSCSTPRQRCQISHPKFSRATDSCVARSFFGLHDSTTPLIPATDSAPFYFTHGLTTIFSVRDNTTIELHCPGIAKAGADITFHVTGRGNFTNPDNCRVQSNQISYIPSAQVAVSLADSSIRSKFAAGPAVTLFPLDDHLDHVNIAVVNVLDMLTGPSSHGLFSSANKHFYFSLSTFIIMCLVLIVITAITYLACTRYRQGINLLHRASLLRCDPEDP
jgi:hypothetical protein